MLGGSVGSWWGFWSPSLVHVFRSFETSKSSVDLQPLNRSCVLVLFIQPFGFLDAKESCRFGLVGFGS